MWKMSRSIVFSVSTFACIHPAIVNVNWFRQKIDFGLIFFGTDATLYSGWTSTFVPGKLHRNKWIWINKWWTLCIRMKYLHFHFTWFFVIAERTIELNVQRFDVFSFWWWLTFCFATSHFFLFSAFSRTYSCVVFGCVN